MGSAFTGQPCPAPSASQRRSISTCSPFCCSGLAGLAGALREHQLYRPTQDPTGQHRLVLQHLADASLQLAREQVQGGSRAAGDGSAAAPVLPAALGVLRGILAVEHRVIQQQLPLLWPLLLWSPEAARQGGDGGVAAAVAGSLVAAFAELRQLQVLLESLTAALLCEPGAQLAGRRRQEAESAAAAVLLGDTFQAALAAALRQLPSGQVPLVLRLAAQAVQQLAGSGCDGGGKGRGDSDCGSAGQLLVLDLYSSFLASLSVDLTTAAAAALAAQALVAALAPALLPRLAVAAAAPADGDGSKKGKGKARERAQAGGERALAALLRLYRRALEVHERCAGLHPKVSPAGCDGSAIQRARCVLHAARCMHSPSRLRRACNTAHQPARRASACLPPAGRPAGGPAPSAGGGRGRSWDLAARLLCASAGGAGSGPHTSPAGRPAQPCPQQYQQ